MSDIAMNDLLPIKEGLVSGDSPDDVRLLGSKCGGCNEVSIGTNVVCLNCGGNKINSIEFSPTGELWTFTIIRHKPPGEYLGPESFEPFGLGLVELPEGLRIMAPLEGDVDSFQIGDQLEIKHWKLTAADGQVYRAFRFASKSN